MALAREQKNRPTNQEKKAQRKTLQVWHYITFRDVALQLSLINVYSINDTGTIVTIWREKIRPSPCTLYKNNSREIKGSKVKSKTSRLGRGSVEECLYDHKV